MTRRKSEVSRPYRPDRVSRETMAYLLDMSTDSFDRLVASGKLPAPAEHGGFKRWNVEQVLASFDSGEIQPVDAPEGVDGNAQQGSDVDPFLVNIGAIRGKAKTDRRRGTA